MAEIPAAASPPRAWRRYALRLGGSALALALLLAFVPVAELRGALARLPPAFWIAAQLGFVAVHVVGVVKWRLVVNSGGAGLGFAQAARCYFLGLFGNLFLPSVVGGDLVRAGLAVQLGRSRAGALLGSLVDRALDLAALVTLAGVGALFVPGTLDGRSRSIFFGFAALAGAGGATLVAALLLLPARRFSRPTRRRLVKGRDALRALARHPARMATAFVLSLAVQGALVAINAGLGRAIGMEVSPLVWLFVWPLAKIAAVTPLTQGGIGVREAAVVALFLPSGVTAATAMAAGLLFEAVVVGGGLLGGGIALLLGQAAQRADRRRLG